MPARLLSLARNERRRALGKPYLTANHTGTSCESDDQGSAGLVMHTLEYPPQTAAAMPGTRIWVYPNQWVPVRANE